MSDVSTPADRRFSVNQFLDEFKTRTGWRPSYRSAMRWAAEGDLRVVKVGGRTFVTEGELRRFVDGRPRHAHASAA